ncbi:MAG: DUF4129 domain-containing protein [Phormidesmis sp.]
MFVFMLEGAYRTNSFAWQTGKLVQQFREWLEYRLSLLEISGPDLPELPDWSLPEIVQQILFWGLVTALAIWMTFLLYRALEQPIRNWLERTQGWTKLGDRTASPDPERSTQYWWQQAQTLAKQGNYKEACKALYRATLQQLHDAQVLPHDASRTDGEYLQSIGQKLNPASPHKSVPRPYQLLIGTHERLVFGIADASGEVFKRCRSAYEQIQKEMQKEAPKQ